MQCRHRPQKPNIISFRLLDEHFVKTSHQRCKRCGRQIELVHPSRVKMCGIILYLLVLVTLIIAIDLLDGQTFLIYVDVRFALRLMDNHVVYSSLLGIVTVLLYFLSRMFGLLFKWRESCEVCPESTVSRRDGCDKIREFINNDYDMNNPLK